MNKTDYVIRRFDMNDVDECIVFNRQMTDYHKDLYAERTMPYNDEGIAKQLKRKDDGVVKVVVEEQGTIIGLLLLEVKEEAGVGKILEIDTILVDKDRRQQGIGRALMDYAKQEAVKRNCTILQASYAARNIDALHFYHTLGIDCLGMIQIFTPVTDTEKKRWHKAENTTQFFDLQYHY